MASPFKSSRAALATVASAALLGAGAATAVAVAVDGGPSTVVREVTVASGQSAASSGTTVGSVYKRTAQSVVEITVNGQSDSTPFGGGQQQAQGSGFVFDAQGHIVTNQHVVDGAQSVSVTFSNGKRYDAAVVGTDSSTDLAVLKVDAPASLLKPLALADSSRVEVGDAVIAIGSPFGLDQTVTTGIVSALHREITAPNNFAIDDAIQTDAAINHGNSGGPLLDLDGKVVGVTSQIESESGGNDGIGFAVPSNTVERIAGALISSGSVEHAYLGVSTEDTQSGAGAAIAQVRPSTPAADAGLRTGDVVTKLDGRTIGSADELRSAIDSKQPGDTVQLTVRRGDGTTTVEVTLGTRPS
ncbi:MAG TPA: trypsin-like peptidase domain-containing protein [Gaiellaceae bacterium]|jgi:putative serine protease PepD